MGMHRLLTARRELVSLCLPRLCSSLLPLIACPPRFDRGSLAPALQHVDDKRHLLRMWLAPEDGRPLPEVYADLWGSTTVSGRGGGAAAVAVNAL